MPTKKLRWAFDTKIWGWDYPMLAMAGLSYSVALVEVGQCTKALPIFDRYYEDLKHEQLASSKIIYVGYAQCLVESGDTTEALSVLSDLEHLALSMQIKYGVGRT